MNTTTRHPAPFWAYKIYKGFGDHYWYDYRLYNRALITLSDLDSVFNDTIDPNTAEGYNSTLTHLGHPIFIFMHQLQVQRALFQVCEELYRAETHKTISWEAIRSEFGNYVKRNQLIPLETVDRWALFKRLAI